MGDDDSNVTRKRQTLIRQFFNCADWIIGDPNKFATEPFDERVTPTLRCAKFDPAQGTYESLRESNKLPLGPEQLWCMFPEKELPTKKLKNASTIDLFRTGLKYKSPEFRVGPIRAVTHMAAPEFIFDDMSIAGHGPFMGGRSQEKALEQNNHVFYREVGHQIRPGNRDSFYLA